MPQKNTTLIFRMPLSSYVFRDGEVIRLLFHFVPIKKISIEWSSLALEGDGPAAFLMGVLEGKCFMREVRYHVLMGTKYNTMLIPLDEAARYRLRLLLGEARRKLLSQQAGKI
ncbi:hypothetical protein [Tichowtungia aerotolerans]|uniref:Uncharacterized protein n=1 Tax=Tichowtungia aerotolerans TaxID=2697043 RepID=A0A6P1MA06_9BACT|nr:hypothetical protein [Tichowtungia aerotolerans]QHI69384.1 hypothetical protein GT409_07935 [Tichowtungia aerotolerans]